MRASSATTLPAVSMVYNEQVSFGKTSNEDTHLLGSRVQLGGPQVAVWMNSNRIGDGVAPGSAKLVVVGGMHVEEVGKSGIEWLRGSLDGE